MSVLSEDARRLLVAMHHGIVIQQADGHRWIEADEIRYEGAGNGPIPADGKWDRVGLTDGPEPLNLRLRRAGLEPIESKCYGSVRAALFEIDGALMQLGEKPLLEQYDQLGGDVAWGLAYPTEHPTEKCPTCAKPALLRTRCRCDGFCVKCENGHAWHRCPVHSTPDQPILVSGAYAHDGRCSCPKGRSA